MFKKEVKIMDNDDFEESTRKEIIESDINKKCCL